MHIEPPRTYIRCSISVIPQTWWSPSMVGWRLVLYSTNVLFKIIYQLLLNNDKYYDIQHELKNDFEPHVDILTTYLWSKDDAKSQSAKTWFDVGIFPFDSRTTTHGYLVDKTPCYTLFRTGASKAMLNKKFYDEHPILHHYPKYQIHVQPIQLANNQPMTVKEAIKFLLPFSTSLDFIFGLKTMTEIEGKRYYSKLEFKFKKRSIGFTPSKDIHLSVGKTTDYEREIVKKPSDLSDGQEVVKMKLLREDCQLQTLRVALVNGKMNLNVTNTGQGEFHLHRGQNIGVIDLRSAGYFHINRDGIQRCLHERFIFLNGKEP